MKFERGFELMKTLAFKLLNLRPKANPEEDAYVLPPTFAYVAFVILFVCICFENKFSLKIGLGKS